jgi:hypothetical protein
MKNPALPAVIQITVPYGRKVPPYQFSGSTNPKFRTLDRYPSYTQRCPGFASGAAAVPGQLAFAGPPTGM